MKSTPKQKLDLAITIVYIAMCVYTSVKYIATDRLIMAPLGLAGLMFLLINPFAERIFKIKLGDSLGIILKIYYLFAFVLGTALRWYTFVQHMDKVMHLLAGIIFALVGFCLFRRFDYDETPRDRKIALQILFALGISMFVAVIWEIYEFTGFLLTGHDAQYHLTNGVLDTMGDIITCFIGGLIMCGDYWLTSKKHISMPLTRLLSAFDKNNDFSVHKK